MTSTMQSGGLTAPACGALRRPADFDRTIDVSGLVDREGGLLDRAIFTDEQIYRQELRRVFATSWLFLAHVDQFHKPGDFFTTYMGEDPVIVTMDKNHRIRAFLNSCRHRVARVCRADFGATRSFTCTYHGWAYDLEGKLISIPNKEGYPDSFKGDDDNDDVDPRRIGHATGCWTPRKTC